MTCEIEGTDLSYNPFGAEPSESHWHCENEAVKECGDCGTNQCAYHYGNLKSEHCSECRG